MKIKNRLLFAVCMLACIIFVWWFDYGSWHPIPIEYLEQFPTEVTFRNTHNEKREANMYTWHSYFTAIDLYGSNPIHRRIYEQYQKTNQFDFSTYTYILSFGFTIEQLMIKGDLNEDREHIAKAIHGYNCPPNAILLYRIPKSWVVPSEDRRSRFHYIFR